MFKYKNLMGTTLSHIIKNLSIYIYLSFIAFIYAYFFYSAWLDSYEKPAGIVVDFEGSISEKKDQAKEKRQGSKFWEHQLQLIDAEIENNEPELLVKQINELYESQKKIYDLVNNDLAKDASKKVEDLMNEKYPEYAKIRELQKHKEKEGHEFDEAIRQEKLQFMYEMRLRQRDRLIQLKEIVVHKLKNAREAEMKFDQKNPR
jgi:hypothetical protein